MLACTKCGSSLGEEFINAPELAACPGCRALTRVEAFPALLRKMPEGAAGETLVLGNEANCFYHPTKRAVIPCDECGRFLCALCDVEFGDRHVCPSCLATGKKKRKIKNLENHRTLYDTITLSLAVLPLLLFWPTILTAPAALFMSVRYWKAPTSIVTRTKARLIAAFILSSLQIVGWSFLIYNWVAR